MGDYSTAIVATLVVTVVLTGATVFALMQPSDLLFSKDVQYHASAETLVIVPPGTSQSMLLCQRMINCIILCPPR